MLKIFNKLKKINFSADGYIPVNNNKAGKPKHYPPANKEWYNSIYAYNLNTVKLLPTMDKVILRFIKSYFNFYSRKLEKNVGFKKLRLRFRRLSTNRILISKAELKHTNDKVIITLYIYNRQKKYYLNKLKTISALNFLKKKSLKYKLYIIKKKGLKIVKKVMQQKKILFINYNNNNYEKNYEIKYLKIFFKICLYKELLSLYFHQILYLNESKFKHNYILPLINLIENFYNKKVDFNLVNLKYLYLNSYILTEIVVTKLKNKKNKLLRILIKSLFKYTVPAIDSLAMYDEMYNKKKIPQNLTINRLSFFNKDKKYILQAISNADPLDFFLYKKYTEKEKLFFNHCKWLKIINDNDMVNDVTDMALSFIKYKSVSGIRLEGAGRLTRRKKADKSISKVRYKGNIRNIDSSIKGLPSVFLRGHAKANLQHTKLKSKKRIGSFGIKGWVSSN